MQFPRKKGLIKKSKYHEKLKPCYYYNWFNHKNWVAISLNFFSHFLLKLKQFIISKNMK